jgi:hypothetical protein
MKCRRKRHEEELLVAMINVFGIEENREEYQRIIEEISEISGFRLYKL